MRKKKLGLAELVFAGFTGIITAMCFACGVKPAAAPPPPVTPPPEECYTPQCLYEKCVALGYPEEWCRSTYLPTEIILPPAPPPEYPPVVVPAVTYTLTIQAGPGGSTVPVPGTYSPMAHDAVVLITAVPDSGYVFDHWTKNAEVHTENPISWSESAENITLIAYFTPVAAPAEIRIGAGGYSLSFSGYSLYIHPPLPPEDNYLSHYWKGPKDTEATAWRYSGLGGCDSSGFIMTINPDYYVNKQGVGTYQFMEEVRTGSRSGPIIGQPTTSRYLP